MNPDYPSPMKTASPLEDILQIFRPMPVSMREDLFNALRAELIRNTNEEKQDHEANVKSRASLLSTLSNGLPQTGIGI